MVHIWECIVFTYRTWLLSTYPSGSPLIRPKQLHSPHFFGLDVLLYDTIFNITHSLQGISPCSSMAVKLLTMVVDHDIRSMITIGKG
jgi:hypothetical protein